MNFPEIVGATPINEARNSSSPSILYLYRIYNYVTAFLNRP